MANIRRSRAGGFIRGGRRMRRETIWASVPVASNTVALGTSLILTGLSAAGLALRPFTVVRVRGLIALRSDQNANSEAQWVSYGHCVVSDQALAIGVTAVPTPVTDAQSDLWFVYEELANAIIVSSATSVLQHTVSKDFDSRAMRKVEEGQDLISVMETPATGITEGVIFRDHFRMLLKLH